MFKLIRTLITAPFRILSAAVITPPPVEAEEPHDPLDDAADEPKLRFTGFRPVAKRR